MNATTHDFSLRTKQNVISPNYNILLCNWKSNILRSSPVPHLLCLCHLPCWQKIALGFIQSLRQAEESRQTVKEGLVCVYCPLQKYLTSGFQGSSSSGPGQGNTTLKRDKEKIKSWAVNTYSLAPLFTKLCLPPTVLWDKLNSTLWKALVLHIQMLKHYIMHCLLALLPHNILIWKLFTLMNNFDFISYGQCHQKRKKMLSECKLFMS